MSLSLSSMRVGEAAGLAALEVAWWELWSRDRSGTPFQSPAWLIPWWQAFAPGELCTIAVWAGRRLVGLAPLYREAGSRRLLPLGVSVSDYQDILLDPLYARSAGAELLSGLARCGDWEAWEMPELPEHANALRLALPEGWSKGQGLASSCPVLLLSADDSLGQGAPVGLRRIVRRANHRAARLGPVELRALPADVGMDLLVELHHRRWKSRGEAGVLADPRVLQFHHAAARRLQHAGLLQCRGLFIGGVPAAMYYGLRWRDRAYAYLSGMDPALAHASPGTLLLHRLIADAARAGVCEFHFLRGRETYKYGWGAADRRNRALVFRRASSHVRAA